MKWEEVTEDKPLPVFQVLEFKLIEVVMYKNSIEESTPMFRVILNHTSDYKS